MNLKELPAVFVSFLSFKLNIQECSPLTVNEYCIDLRCFFKYIIAQRNDIEEKAVDISVVDAKLAESVTRDEIFSYLLYLAKDKKIKPTTRSRKLSAIKSFYKYHTTSAFTFSNNPAKDIDSPKLKYRLPVVMTLDEARCLLSSFDKTDPNYRRNYLIVLLFLNCGMRLSELVGINLSDIDSDFNRFVVRGKGGKIRILYFNDACKAALVDYLGVREMIARSYGKKVKNLDALFLSSQGNRISVKTVQWMIKRQLEISGLSEKGYSVHKLRHTAATLMYNEGGVDILVLKEILGHSQLNTTQIYTHVRRDDVQYAISQNPLNGNFEKREDERSKKKAYKPKTSRKPLFTVNDTIRKKYGVEASDDTEGKK